MAGPSTVTAVIIDVDESTFQREVVERSRQVPVVVDFWAAWCGPCRTLGPILEGLANEYGGRFILARLDVDANQYLAARYNIQGIPAVKAFKGGQVASEFVGALPRPAVRQFIEKLVPNAEDEKVAEGQALLAAGQPAAAEARFRAALTAAPDHPAALLGLARVQLAQGEEDAAAETLALIPAEGPEEAAVRQMRADLALRRETKDLVEGDLRARVAAEPADLEARYSLAGLLTAQERFEEALEEYLAVVRRDRHYHDDGARHAMLNIFERLGEVPLARTYRNRLASVLFA